MELECCLGASGETTEIEQIIVHRTQIAPVPNQPCAFLGSTRLPTSARARSRSAKASTSLWQSGSIRTGWNWARQLKPSILLSGTAFGEDRGDKIVDAYAALGPTH